MASAVENLTVGGYSKRVPKPWGYETVFTPATGLPYVGKLLHVLGGRRLSLQIHEVKTETLMLLSGSAWLSLEEDSGALTEFQMQCGVGYTVLPGRQHRVSAVSDSLLVEASTPEQGRTIRLDDDYGRPDELTGSGAQG